MTLLTLNREATESPTAPAERVPVDVQLVRRQALRERVVEPVADRGSCERADQTQRDRAGRDDRAHARKREGGHRETAGGPGGSAHHSADCAADPGLFRVGLRKTLHRALRRMRRQHADMPVRDAERADRLDDPERIGVCANHADDGLHWRSSRVSEFLPGREQGECQRRARTLQNRAS